MSVDGEILTDLKRLLLSSASCGSFLLVGGPAGSGRSVVLRSIAKMGSLYGFSTLTSAKDCFLPSSDELVKSESKELVPSMFFASFYDLKQICEQFLLSKQREASTSFRSSSNELREGLVLIVDDIEAMWQLADLHGLTPQFQALLAKLYATKSSVLVTSGTDERDLPEEVQRLGRFITYALPPKTNPAACRLFLRALSTRLPPDAVPSCPSDPSNPSFLNEEKLVNSSLIQASSGSTTSRSLVYGKCVGLDLVHQYQKNRMLSKDASLVPVASFSVLNVKKLRQDVKTGLQSIEKNSAKIMAGEKQNSINTTSHPIQSSPTLFGLADIEKRLSMLLDVFISQSSGALSGKLLSSVSSTTGVLLHGPSGCGKTALTKSLQRKFPHVPFFHVQCTSLFSKYLGESEQRLRDIYTKARGASPSVVVLDDLDVIALSRGSMQQSDGNGGVNVSKRMLAVLLCELDGLSSDTGVLTIATTNVPDVVDPAMLRQGRLETIIFVPPLSRQAAEEMCTPFLGVFFDEREEQGSVAQYLAAAVEGCSPSSLKFVLRQIMEQLILPSLADTSSHILPKISPPTCKTLVSKGVRQVVQDVLFHTNILKPQKYQSRLLS